MGSANQSYIAGPTTVGLSYLTAHVWQSSGWAMRGREEEEPLLHGEKAHADAEDCRRADRRYYPVDRQDMEAGLV